MSGFLWASDFLIIGLFLCWFLRARYSGFKLKFDLPDYFLIGFFIVAGLSASGAGIKALSIYHLFKLAEFIGIYFYIKYNYGIIFNFNTGLFVLVGAGLIQSIIAIGQSFRQAGFGLKIIGESPSLSPYSPGVAAFVADGEKFMRAYGTTPHPNVLAVFFLLALFSFYWLYFSPFLKKNDDIVPMAKVVFYKYGLAIYSLILFAFFLTFSRTMVVLWGAAVFTHLLFLSGLKGNQFWRDNKKRILNIATLSIVVVVIFSIFYWPQIKSRITISGDDEAVSQRIYYNKIAGSVSKDSPIFGVGIGQFVPKFMKQAPGMYFALYQPVHNIYLLVLSEIGYLGLGMFLIFLILTLRGFFKKISSPIFHNRSFVVFIFAILAIGLFDHFLLTLQPGRMIFWVMLGLMGATTYAPNLRSPKN